MDPEKVYKKGKVYADLQTTITCVQIAHFNVTSRTDLTVDLVVNMNLRMVGLTQMIFLLFIMDQGMVLTYVQMAYSEAQDLF